MSNHIKTGAIGEERAVNYLLSKGYIIIETNWRFGHKEIDIIVKKGNILVIAEVKTRRSKAFEKPYEAVTQKKQEFLIEAAEAYVIGKNLDLDVQFDIISIYINNETTQIEHIQNAFSPQF